MSSAVSPQWQDKATGFFSSSGVKLKEAGQSAGTFVGEVAKDAKGNVADVAEKVGSAVKTRWAILREPSTRHAMQERLITAAATTGMFFRKGISETKDKVTVGKTKVEEVAKKTAQKSKTILTDIERWQKGVASTDVFGVPIEVTVQRQQFSRPVPHILVKCADYLILSGLNSVHLFKAEGDKKVIQQLVSLYNQDSNASLPEGLNPIDVAYLVKCYLASLPEPLTTFELYDEIKGARSSVHAMKNILKKLPAVNYMTLEFITALLLRVSHKSLLNKMDARTIALEMAPVIMWQKERKPEFYRSYWNHVLRSPSNKNMDPAPTYSSWDMLSEESEGMDASSLIPLDDGMPVDFSAIDVVQCLIEQHNAVFTDADETGNHCPTADIMVLAKSGTIGCGKETNPLIMCGSKQRKTNETVWFLFSSSSMANRILPITTLVFLLTLFSMVIGDDGVGISKLYPLVVSTWPFKEAVRAAWRAVDGGLSAVDAVVEGCSACEELRCDGTVGPGGSPDENGETTIDAMIMNGVTMEVGAVAAMRYVKDGIRAAKLVMQHTKHTLLVGEKASAFAISMGLPGPSNLSSADSIRKWSKWKENHCQPNFWKDVVPVNSCGPYHAKGYMDVKEGDVPHSTQWELLNQDHLLLAVTVMTLYQ
ncbi:unnamed protein product [Dovyalis caffra]|uniref:Rho-GAP domain-containing protein n=1 Tax=Dovyalis caffra TaxID=77055 RepID=A0AAV1SVZ7_9ROSI|nr:unnamed protein product [Dovyalis caffra]